MERKQRRRLGELLVEGGILTEKQLKTALGYQRHNGGKLAEVIVLLGLASESQLMFTLSEQLGIPYRKVGDFKVADDVVRLIPSALIHKHRVLPLAAKPGHPRPKLLVAMTDPQDLQVVDDLAFASGYAIVPVLVSVPDLERAYRTNGIHGLKELARQVELDDPDEDEFVVVRDGSLFMTQ